MTAATAATSRDRFYAVAGTAASDARVPVEVRTGVADRYDAYRRAHLDRDGEGMFAGLPDGIRVGCYYSLAVGRSAIPDCLIETASTADQRDAVMADRHEEAPHIGVQFHLESILTGGGNAMVRNVLALCQRWVR